jgi:hypothetical protein
LGGMLKRMFIIGACGIALCGCASSDPSHLTYHQSLNLITAVNGWAAGGGPMPPEVKKLEPLQVYTDHGNYVIVLQRDAHSEKGYYVIPSTSSYDPHFRPDPGWTLTPMGYFDPNFDDMYQYSRKY